MDPKVSSFFHGYAVDFNAIYGNEGGLLNGLLNRWFRRSMEVRFVKTLAGCQPIEGKTVLDIGCGPGHYSVALAKMGARAVQGIDFAEGMLDIARKRAVQEGVAGNCRFDHKDFFRATMPERYDFVFAMGFMDYVEDARATVHKIHDLTREKAFLSFPAAGGFLAWQRQMRYRSRCPLFLYSRPQIESLFEGLQNLDVTIERIHRDYFVTVRKM